MIDEELFRNGNTAVRRLRLDRGEAMPWHRDPYPRVAVILQGDRLAIEFAGPVQSETVDVAPGQVEWEEPSSRVHRAVNIGQKTYEQITIFLLDRPDAVPQPVES